MAALRSLQKWRSTWRSIAIILLYFLTTALAKPTLSEEHQQTQNESRLPLWTAEDVRFAETRCRADSGIASEDGILTDLWLNRTYPDNHVTYCYIKCFLKKLGLINLRTRGLDSKRIRRFSDNIAEPELSTEDCWDRSDLDEFLSGTCHSYYRKWMSLKSNCSEMVDLIMYRPMNVVYNEPPPPSKPFGVPATEFCSAQKYNASNDPQECLLGCVFKHFRYFDAYGRLDEFEIRRSFREANFFTLSNLAAIRRCTHGANSSFQLGECEMAQALNDCFHKTTKVFANVCQLRDKLTQMF